MIGGDAIGFHAIAEMITDITSPITYLSVSRPTSFASGFFVKRYYYDICY